MSAGDLHVFADGYRFYETVFGSLVQRTCVDCATTTFATPEYGSPRCSGCAREHYGLRQISTRKR